MVEWTLHLIDIDAEHMSLPEEEAAEGKVYTPPTECCCAGPPTRQRGKGEPKAVRPQLLALSHVPFDLHFSFFFAS